MDTNTIICRCQDITYGEILHAIADGAETVTGVKKRVGSGMGICQGKYCEKLIMNILAEQTGKKPAELLPDTRRAPARPVEAAAFLED